MQNSNTTGRTARKQVPAIAKMISPALSPGMINLDIGAGPYDDFSNWLRSRGVMNLPTDLEHPTALGETIDEQLEWLDKFKALGGWIDTVTISNVLNVIEDDIDLRSTLRFAADYVRPKGKVYVTVYEGDRSGEGRKTRDGYQRHEKLALYMAHCAHEFHEITKRGNLLILSDAIQYPKS